MPALRSRRWLAPLLVAALSACDSLLAPPASSPARLSVDISRAALAPLAAPGAREAFDAVDSARVVLVNAATRAGTDPFQPDPGRLLDTTVAITPGDTLRLSLELADSAVTQPTEVVFGLLLKWRGEPLFVFVDSIAVTPNQTTRALVPVLFPVPARLQLTTPRDSIAVTDDSTRVYARGFFATGDSIPDAEFFPSFLPLDGNLAVTDVGTSAVVRSAGVAGSGRVEARAQGYAADVTDTVWIHVRRPTPVGPDTAVFDQLAVGGSFACGLRTEGSAWCWGNNVFAEFGNGTTTGSSVPVEAAGGAVFDTLVAGGNHACGLSSSGDVYCWGRNDSGQLGLGTTGGSPQVHPARVAGGPWLAVSAGYDHSCAIDSGGALYCWGNNFTGAVGVASPGPIGSPTRVGTDLWSYVSAGGKVTCGVNTTGGGYCWGAGANGMIGDGTTNNAFSPTHVPGGPWIKIRVGLYHVCGINQSGTIYCWGSNSYGQLGTAAAVGDTVPFPQATLVQASLSSLDPGSFHTCIVRQSDGTYKCWGDDSDGQRGEGTPPPPGWRVIDASIYENFTCALRLDQKAFCWGYGAFGNLGNGDTAEWNVPVPVTAPGSPVTVPRRSVRGR